jgi:SAM-dependent methyltransferase
MAPALRKLDRSVKLVWQGLGVGVEDTYDAVAEAYEAAIADELDRKPFDRDLLDGLATRLSGLVADIGCGPAHVGRHLVDRGVDVVGVDLSAEMLRVAQRRNPGMRFEQADFRSLPFADGELGGAVAFYSLIHLDSLDDALPELARVIRPGGLLCVALHEGEGTIHLDEWFGHAVDIDAFGWSLDALVGAVIDAGFTIESAIARPPYEAERTTRLYVTATR